jgi:hypothetical protein
MAEDYWDTSDIKVVFNQDTTARMGVGLFYVNTMVKIFIFNIWEL